MKNDSTWMQRSLALAERGLLTTTPNPRVGCVIVRDDQLLGEGWHEFAGQPHAEVNALNDVQRRGFSARGATAYVSLEPCCHSGRTPPCTGALIRAGIKRVVAAISDPNPEAAHGGEVLRAAGIEYEAGVEEAAARELNIGFFSRMQRQRPWLRLKIAMSIDGRTALADGRSQWITGSAARADGHRFRARACAILTGSGTVLADNPSLSVREVDTPRQPLRIVLDRQAKTPPTSQVLSDGGATLMVSAVRPQTAWPQHVESLLLPATGNDGRYSASDLKLLMQMLAQRQINELHVEAGARLNGALLEADLIDELLIYVSGRVLGDRALPLFHLSEQPRDLDLYNRFELFNSTGTGEDLRLRLRRKES